jgi:hypothetical protein
MTDPQSHQKNTHFQLQIVSGSMTPASWVGGSVELVLGPAGFEKNEDFFLLLIFRLLPSDRISRSFPALCYRVMEISK